MNTILVTPRSMSDGAHPGLKRLEARGYQLRYPTPGEMPSQEALINAIPGCVGWIAGVEPVSPAVIEAADCLKAISRNGSGVDNLPLELLAARKIAVRRAEGANANGVAELAVVLMLSGFRHVPLNDRGIRGNTWPRVLGKEIDGAAMGVVGLGAIGARVARKFLALGARVIGLDPFTQPSDLMAHDTFSLAQDIATLIDRVDGLTLHLPHKAGSPPLLDATVLGHAKPGLTVVNTARAGLVDQDAMYHALRSGQVATYATDVYPTEPPAAHPLWLHDGCISTSHVGGLTNGSVDRIVEVTVNNLLSALEPAHD